MPKKFIKRYLPDPHSIKENRALKIFGSILHEPNLWHLNRKSASGAFGIGLFEKYTGMILGTAYEVAAPVLILIIVLIVRQINMKRKRQAVK